MMSHSRTYTVMACLAIVAACTTATPQVAPQPSAPEFTGSCLVLGFGQWAPREPDWIPQPWRRILPALRLESRPLRGEYFRDARLVGAAPEAGADTVGPATASAPDARIRHVLYGWRAPSPDSLVLFDPVALDNGIQIRGVWREEIFRGRAHSSSDLIAPEIDPRANAYAVRYACGDRRAWQRTRETIAELVAQDVSDLDASAREIAEVRARLDEARNRVRRP